MRSRIPNDFILHFTGKIRYDTIGILINELKSKVISLGIQTNLYKRILLVMIESLENIMKYTADNAASNPAGKKYLPCFYIEKKDKKYILGSSNLIENSHISKLKKRLDHLNKLDNQELKELYKTTITDGQFSHKGGAGLGFIELAKISSEKIKYSFEPVDPALSYFRFIVTIE